MLLFHVASELHAHVQDVHSIILFVRLSLPHNVDLELLALVLSVPSSIQKAAFSRLLSIEVCLLLGQWSAFLHLKPVRWAL